MMNTYNLQTQICKKESQYGVSCIIANQIPGNVDYNNNGHFLSFILQTRNTKIGLKKAKRRLEYVVSKAVEAISNLCWFLKKEKETR
tara:strand:+ start:87 stop:347 length:261 start_codon:yes stop_codon:yes gene_type:complete